MILGYDQSTLITAAILAVIAIAVIVKWLMNADARAIERAKKESFQRAETSAFSVPPAAYLTETVTLTGVGGFCALFLIVLNVAIPFAFLFGASNAIQQTVIGVMWIALNQVLGVGLIVGRRRTLTMRRPEQPQEAEGREGERW